MHLKEIVENIFPTDPKWMQKARERSASLVMPHRALGRLHEFAERICTIRETLEPSVKNKAVLIMAGDHGVAAEGVSAYPQEVTGAMIATFLRGGAGINALCRHVGAEVFVTDMGIIPDTNPADFPEGHRLRVEKIARGTANIAKEAAMRRSEAEHSLLTGFAVASEKIAGGIDVLATGDMGIGNTTPSAALGAVFTGAPLEKLVGPGTGLDAAGVQRKRDIVRRAIEIHQPAREDPIGVLAQLGGFEIGAIAGTLLAAAYHRRPVVVDGFISTAGALVANALAPAVRDYMFAGHLSEEHGHAAMLSHLGMEPILQFGMRLGEGTGAALALGILDASVKSFREIFTFEEAAVPDKK